ncbi:SUMF1/EgtB/PvdO family nonheme iron enzyme [Prosthecobacter sp.]|uniref:SUMF1/EgtB/PvdO family nonheme iron enzyme n=1 Tax=Prosthecobacter sp. TaxID=1965333 RepID=UPI0024893328|nr:SUMF1/EgtB/PvdO family nonheme iron enzyme [Prosthecobacter sp.]MDI1315021.1 SUMF1/EgtB/PvdO family nonheme iron enzyme [Prosthecobacter sp.]
MKTALTSLLIFAGTLSILQAAAPQPPPHMVFISGGDYKPLYAKESKSRKTQSFFMAVAQVTNGEFLQFVKAHPEWQKSKVRRSLADANYLSNWAGDLELGDKAPGNAPVTYVSWFAAKACCEAQGKRLPTQDEWEFVARADATNQDASTDPAYLRQLLEWYSKPATSALEDVHTGTQNVYGLRGMHGLVWEWVQDFNSTLLVGDSRGDGSLERKLFCGAGALLATDVTNYAAFMRYALRSSLKGAYCVGSLGFRAAQSITPGTPKSPVIAFATVYDLPGEWRGQDNKPATLASLRGKVHVVTMGFTRCQFACPRILSDMQHIEQALGKDAARTGFVFLSIDPQYDTPEQMTATMLERSLSPARWTFLAAPADVVQQSAVALDFKYQLVDGFFAHSNLIAVLDADGRVVLRVEALGADIQPVVDAVRKQLEKH